MLQPSLSNILTYSNKIKDNLRNTSELALNITIMEFMSGIGTNTQNAVTQQLNEIPLNPSCESPHYKMSHGQPLDHDCQDNLILSFQDIEKNFPLK